MTRVDDHRPILLRLALSLFVVGTGVFFSPLLVQNSYASAGDVTCTATCDGGSCTGNKPYCVCSCSFWFNRAVCTCSEPTSPSGGSAPPEQTPTTGP